jgi:hypothetical protein
VDTNYVAKAKADGRYKGRPEDEKRNDGIIKVLTTEMSWNSIISATDSSRSTISRLAKRPKPAQVGAAYHRRMARLEAIPEEYEKRLEQKAAFNSLQHTVALAASDGKVIKSKIENRGNKC